MASRITSINLDERLARFAEGKVRAGTYRSVDEVVATGLKLLEDEDARRTALLSALAEGEASGPAIEFDFDAFLASKRRR